MEILIIAMLLAIFGTAYIVALSYTKTGRALNSAPELQPPLTAVGLIPVVLGIGHLYGAEVAAVLLLLLTAVGTPSLLRGLWRLARNYVSEAEARGTAAKYARNFARRD